MGGAFLGEAFVLVPNRQGDRDREAQEIVGSEAFGLIHVLVEGILDADANALPGLGFCEGGFDARLFGLQQQKVHIRPVDRLWACVCEWGEFFDETLQRVGNGERFLC